MKPTRSRSGLAKPVRPALDGVPFALPRVTPAQRRRAVRLLDALAAEYPDAACQLDYSNPHELLVATILSAQTTDVGVNKVTPALFTKFPTPADYAASTPAQIEPYITRLGLFRNKAKAIQSAMKDVAERFGGGVPARMEDLLTLRGVARKTANVVLGNAFGINNGFVVDTHIGRLAVRMGLADEEDSVALIERKLMALFPRERWCDASHQIIFHGRRVCTARGHYRDEHPICREFGVGCPAPSSGAIPPPRGRG